MSGGTVSGTDNTIALDYGTGRPSSSFDERIRSPHVSRIQAVLLLLIFAVALTVRFIGIERLSVFMDEIWVVELAMGNGQVHDAIPFNEVQRNVAPPTKLSHASSALNIVRQVQGITHPPGYVFALRL